MVGAEEQPAAGVGAAGNVDRFGLLQGAQPAKGGRRTIKIVVAEIAEMALAVGPAVHALAGVADGGADVGMALLDAGAQRATFGLAERTQVELTPGTKSQRRNALQHRPIPLG